jgi:hypothetical protein
MVNQSPTPIVSERVKSISSPIASFTLQEREQRTVNGGEDKLTSETHDLQDGTNLKRGKWVTDLLGKHTLRGTIEAGGPAPTGLAFLREKSSSVGPRDQNQWTLNQWGRWI